MSSIKIITYGPIHPEFEESLRAILKRSKTSVMVEVEPASERQRQLLDEWEEGDPTHVLGDHFTDTTYIRFLISVPKGHSIAMWCRAQAAQACWGCSNAFISVEYAPKQHCLTTQLHEAMHSLGVDDCYDENVASFDPKDNCSCDDCLMRYGSPSTNVCDVVLSQLRDFKPKPVG